MKHIIAIFATLTTIAAAAQTPEQIEQPDSLERWTLERCMTWAVEHSAEANIEQARVDIAKHEYIRAIAQLLPSLSASSSAYLNFGRGLDPNTNTYAEQRTLSNSYGASSSMVLSAGLRGVNGVRLARVGRAAGRNALEQRRDEVAAATMEAFFEVLYLQKMTVFAAARLDESRLNLRQTERMEELGVKGFPDVAEMRAQEAATAYNLTVQQTQLTIGIIRLKAQMNFPLDRPLAIAPYDIDLPVVKAAETAAAIYDRALGTLPAARAAEMSLRQSELELQIARGARFPTLTAGGGISTGYSRVLGSSGQTASFGDQIRNKRGHNVGLSLSVPIFGGYSTSAAIARSRKSLDIARIERDDALRALYTTIEQAVADMNGAADRYTQAVRQREAAAAAHELNVRKYDEGIVSALELHTSSNRLAEARATELNVRLTWILKKRMVDYYSGGALY